MHLSNFFEEISNQLNTGLPFVAYRKPKTLSIKAVLQENDNIFYVEDYTEKGFVFAPFDNKEDSILIPLDHSKVIKTDHIFSNTIEKIQDEYLDDELAKKQHINIIKKAICEIETNLLLKVVISRKEKIAIKNSNPIEIFKRLLNKYKDAFVYCWYHPKVGLWLGATPEILLKLEGNRFSTMALAGTQIVKDDSEVKWGDKEIEEQQFVTDFITKKINSLTNTLTVSAVKTVKAGNLLHLRTDISGLFKKESGLEHLISVLHPTPAVCGLPMKAAKSFVLQNENYKREFYTGFLGELNLETELASRSSKRNIENRAYTIKKNQTELFVNLRCMQLQDKNAILYIGGGVTKASIPEKEWEETVSKSLIMKTVL